MRVLFIVPHSNVYRTEVNLNEPLGVCYVAAAVREQGHEVKLLHRVDPTALPLEAFRAECRRFGPDVVAMSTMTESHGNGLALLAAVKDGRPVTTVLGGVHVTGYPEAVQDPRVDFGISGEGERAFPALLRRLEAGDTAPDDIPGLLRKGETGLEAPLPFERIRDLDTLPRPIRDGLPRKRYRNYQAAATVRLSGQRLAAVAASRGCPFDCIFCPNQRLTRRILITRSVEGVMEEVEALVRDRAANLINFNDENFGYRRSWLRAFCAEKARRRLTVPYFANVSISDMDAERISLLVRSGCAMTNVGIESGDDEALSRIHKQISTEQAVRVLREMRRAGLAVTANFLIGFPWEDPDAIRRNTRTARRLEAMWLGLNVVTPYPGTRLREMLEEEGFEIDGDFDRYTGKVPLVATRHLDRGAILRYASLLNRSFYVRPGYVWSLLRFFRRRPDRFLPFVSAAFHIGVRFGRLGWIFRLARPGPSVGGAPAGRTGNGGKGEDHAA